MDDANIQNLEVMGMASQSVDDHEMMRSFLHDTHWFNFELTNFCNITCLYCSNQYLKNKGYMSFEVFKRVFDNLFRKNTSPKEVIFCGYGEPFLNPNIYDMMDYVTDHGVKLTIQTNGKWKVNQERIASLYKVHRLSVTIDGVTNRVYNLSRPNTDVDAIFGNLKDIVKLRQQDGVSSPIITAKMNVFSFNKQEVHPFIRKCEDLNFDQINVSKGYGTGVEATLERSEFVKYLNPQLNVDERLFVNGLSPTGDTNTNINSSAISRDILNTPANLFVSLGCFNTATIKWDGTLSPCCADVDFNIPLGNISQSHINEVITVDNLNLIGRKILESRNSFRTKVPCVTCDKFLNHFERGMSCKLLISASDNLKSKVPESLKRMIIKAVRTIK